MRLSPFLVGAALLVAFGLLGFRIIDLEQRVAGLDKELRDRESQGPSDAPSQPSERTISNVAPKAYETQIRTLEARVAALESGRPELPVPSGNLGADRLRQEQSILSVMERENSRIRDVQLEWHKGRWIETRKQQLAAFAYAQNLEPAQTAELYQSMESELDGLVEVMKRPNFAEEPDQIASDWLKVLSQTDHRAHEVLNPAQYQTWLQVRVFERRVLWPWLPDTAAETAQR
jgi:hypothetical protein